MVSQNRRITAHEATVKTATVEVKSLTISGKQVTLAVFRQLLTEDLIAYDTAQLQGVPWGLVNYFWQGCLSDAQRDGWPYYQGSHLHVVWQRGNELRRSCVFERRPRNTVEEEEIVRKQKDVEVKALALAKVITCHKIQSNQPVTRHADGKRIVVSDERAGGLSWFITMPDVGYMLQRGSSDDTYLRNRLNEMIQHETTELGVGSDPDAWIGALAACGVDYQEYTQQYLAAQAREDGIMARYKQQFHAVSQLDQLFIAV